MFVHGHSIILCIKAFSVNQYHDIDFVPINVNYNHYKFLHEINVIISLK